MTHAHRAISILKAELTAADMELVDRMAKRLLRQFLGARDDMADALVAIIKRDPVKFLTGKYDDAIWQEAFAVPLEETWRVAAASIIETSALREFGKLKLKPELFNVENRYTTAWLDNHGGELIRAITKDTRNGVRVLVGDIIKEGGGTGTVSRITDRIGDTVGMLPRDVRSLLKREGLMRAKGYSEDRIAQEVQKGAERAIENRARMIASTETARAQGAGVTAAWKDAAAQELLPRGMRRIWISSGHTGPHSAMCELCDLLNDTTTGMDEPWQVTLSNGKTVRVQNIPAHPYCVCAVALVPPESWEAPTDE